LFTDIPPDEIDRKYSNLSGSDLNDIKILLADETTTMLHGPSCLSSIHSTVSSLYSSSHSSQSPDSLTALPHKNISLSSTQFSELTIVDLLIKAEITSSKNECRRCLESGSIRIDGMKILDMKLTIEEICAMSLQNGNPLGKTQFKISNGKKKHYLVLLEVKD
jgi:tyrosyl-tRNA synthetase